MFRQSALLNFLIHRAHKHGWIAVFFIMLTCNLAFAQSLDKSITPFDVQALSKANQAQSDNSASNSASVDLAYGAFQRGYYITAFQEAMKRVNANALDAPAMTLVGELYAEGLGIKKNSEEALRWYRLACLQNNREACFAEALLYLQGNGVTQNKVEAKTLFEKAASQDHAGAWYNLGVMALEGEGANPQPDFVRAAMSFTKGAELGDMDAAYSLAILYKEGRGVEKNLAAAEKWLHIAADGKNISAEVEYAIMLFRNNEAKGENADPSVDVRAARYLIEAASRHNPVAENRLARLFAAGRGVPKDYIASAKWHVLARASGIEDAWLDGILNSLSPQDKDRVEAAVSREIGP